MFTCNHNSLRVSILSVTCRQLRLHVVEISATRKVSRLRVSKVGHMYPRYQLHVRYLGYTKGTSAMCKVSRLRSAEKVSGLRAADISTGAISLYKGIITN